MKKLLHIFLPFCLLLVFCKVNAQQAFTIGAPSNDYTITCANPVVTMTADAGTAPFSYTWTGPSGTLTGNCVQINVPGLWACTGRNTVTSYSNQLAFTIYSNMQQPTVVITPTINNITCAGGSGCFTMTSNLGPNVTTNWYMMNGSNKVYVGAPQGTFNVFCAGAPGVYWGESINNDNGCPGTRSVQVTASVGMPIFTVSSPSNFSLGCSNASITSMQVTSVITSPVPNVPTSYTFMTPPVTSTPTTFTTNPNFNGVTVPGLYVVYVRDLTNNCTSSQSINVVSSTVTPNVYLVAPSPMLTCKDPTTAMTAVFSDTNTIFFWWPPTFPAQQTVFTQTIQVNIFPSITNGTNIITSIGTYSLYANGSNSCVSVSTIQVMQDIRKPKFTISPVTNSIISCGGPSVVIVPVVTPTLAVALVPTYTWYPPPVGSYTGTQYETTVPGTHTAISMSSVNGCTYSTTYNVASDNSIGAFGGNIYVSCPITTAVVSPTFTANQSTMTYSWSGAPGSIISVTNQSTITVNAIGVYTCEVTNIQNSCTYTIYCSVECINGIKELSLTQNILIYPNPSNGNIQVEVFSRAYDTRISVFDLQGKLLAEKPLSEGTNKLFFNLSKGCYLYKIMSGNLLLKRNKLLIE